MTPPLGPSAWRRLFSSDGDLLRRAAAKVNEATELTRSAGPREALELTTEAMGLVGPEPTAARGIVLTGEQAAAGQEAAELRRELLGRDRPADGPVQ